MKNTKCSCCGQVDTFILLRSLVDGSAIIGCTRCDCIHLWPLWKKDHA